MICTTDNINLIVSIVTKKKKKKNTVFLYVTGGDRI